ncbi:hypothetical protein CLV62_11461 [Dysgonomonas alginatilytica]|uniref:Uncharacterized protein n=1 Tax=Dysgonomonas alginatilytica TaxID=1605892 RepID=A0A2V3PQB6_9BACT|nr:hypothetical protein [Dysgonomonas alginatilytica]PXV63344.1 hypothetical protein CLV62_11461 [Dysgonomonas alginatilytica]
MGTKQLSLTTIFILFVLSVYSQSDNINIVKKYYPQIYTSIKNEADKQWVKDQKILKAIIEGQATSFIQIAESQAKIDPIAMTNALLFGSLDGEEEYNKTILDDLRIENPYPLLRCNWYKVKDQYDKTKNIKTSADIFVPDNQKTAVTENNDIYKDEIYGKERIYSKNKNSSISTKDRKFYESGLGLGLGLSTISNLSDWGTNANPGTITEIRGWVKMPNKKQRFFGLMELSIGYIHHSLYDFYYNTNSNIDQFYIGTRMMYGYHKNLSPTTSFSIGLGGFLIVNMLSNENKYKKEKNGSPTSNFLKDINGGLSALFAFEKGRYEFALIPDWGLADMSRDGSDFKSRTISLSISYLF